MFELIISKYLGYCFGVSRAMKTLFDTISTQHNGSVYTYGPIIHNRRITDQLEQRGVAVIEQIDQAEPGSLVFIRTHGVSDSVKDQLCDKGVSYVDLTCPYVQKIHQIARQCSHLIIAGDIDHPEVQGIVGDAAGNCDVVRSLAELKELLHTPPFFLRTLVVQTTFQMEEWMDMKKYVLSFRKTASDWTDSEGLAVSPVTVCDTICSSTYDRQREVKQMAETCDFIVIVGDKHSSNTKKLYELASARCEACFIEDFTELPHNLGRYKKIGLSAGASTPDSTIEEVINNMNENNVTTMSDEDFDFAQALETSLQVTRVGQRKTGVVSVIGSNEVQLELGGKHTGFIPLSEFSEEELSQLKVGDEIDAFVMKVSDSEGTALMSKKKLDSIKGFEKIEAAKESGEILSGKVAEVVKGGLVVYVNSVRVFIPASQSSLRRDTDLEAMRGQDVRLRIIEVENGKRRRVIGSIRSVLKEERDASQAEVWANIEEGKVYTGVVKSLASFGAFVDIGGVDGLVHISDLSWSKLKHPSEVLAEGQTVEVVVKSFDPETHKISLSYKKDADNPWLLLKEKYQVGDVIPVKVLKLMTYGAFVSVVPGIDGLVHISQIANHRVEKVSDALKVGQEVNAKIIEINYETQKISLSIKAALEENEDLSSADDETAGVTE